MNKDEVPHDDQGINTENVLEISEKIIRRAWIEISDDEKEISLDDLQKIVNITNDAYVLGIKALEIGYNLTQDYLDGLDYNSEGDEDFFDEDEDDNDFN